MSITTGAELNTFVTGLNADAAIDLSLLEVLIDNAKTVIEEERPWMALRRTNTDLSVVAGDNAPVSLASITDFSRFHSREPIRVFDGGDRVDYFDQVPFDRRLDYKDVSNTFCHDLYNNQLYFNGNVPFGGTLYLNYIATTPAIDLAVEAAVWTQFPKRFLPLLGFYAMGIFAGGVDYDSISAKMSVSHYNTMDILKKALEKWDDELQQSELVHNDPTDYLGSQHRNGAINRY